MECVKICDGRLSPIGNMTETIEQSIAWFDRGTHWNGEVGGEDRETQEVEQGYLKEEVKKKNVDENYQEKESLEDEQDKKVEILISLLPNMN